MRAEQGRHTFSAPFNGLTERNQLEGAATDAREEERLPGAPPRVV